MCCAIVLFFFQRNDSLSGWDRTPLFVSLIRCIAWSEGAAHASLSVDEMLYLTLSYDWMLFRHRLADRMARREGFFLGGVSVCFA
jgi:myotubularin-related protein 14